ncbi:MAG: ATPase, T2SS/T4P/T4SS family [Candidatus Omnitrophota bacterium]
MAEKNRLGDVLISWKLITPEDLESALKEQKEKGGFLGQILINKGLVSPTDISRALEFTSAGAKEKTELGQMLLVEKLITEDALKSAQERQKNTKQNLDDILIESGLVTADQIAGIFSRHLGVPYLKLSEMEIKLEVLQLIPENIIRTYQVVPVKLEAGTLSIAMSDPLNLIALDEIKLVCHYKITPVISTKKDIQRVIERYFSLQQMVKQMLADIRLDRVTDEASVSRLVDTVIQAGISARASDIHLEPQHPEMRVRFRIDGILHDIITIPRATEGSLVSRVKVLADMDITEHRRPQDGHISLKISDKEFDLRVSSISTITGEKIVIRILDKSSMLLGMSELGLSDRDKPLLASLVNRPYGIILVTGPTGSGKTSTLYAILSQMDTLTKNVVTIEDPVEYKLEGINQEQVNPAANITFSTGLRAILRQDPDVIMVGEIRDQETATIAIQAALTGHLVLSTLHTNDAPSAVTRLIDMGVEPFLISSSLIGVVAQRLVRVICPSCKEAYAPTTEQAKELGLSEKGLSGISFYRGKGCPDCVHSGYRGRTGVFEIMHVSDKMQDLILAKQPATKIREVAISEGMSTLKDSALEKVMKGISTPAEIKRVIFTAE